jgi:ZIP family zinc transporter
MEDNVQLAFLLTILAGLSTGIGSLIAFFVKEKSTKILTFSMGFAAGVMLYVSFVEIFPEATHKLTEHLGCEEEGMWVSVAAFFGGMFLVGLIDRLLPSAHNPHELVDSHDVSEKRKKDLMRVGTLTAVALAIHNFPEGIATFVTTLEDPELGITIAAAIAIHNIPEGIAVSMPIYHATGDRKKAFMYSFLSGMVEPLGAIIGYLILGPYLGDMVMGILLSGVAGIMVFISLDQLLPAAEEYGHHHLSTYGVILGMLVMASSLMMMVGHHTH